MSLITYEDKVALNENTQIADINKVTADDMNQIKNAINNLFPVGFIIGVDNAEFDPNTSWGGTWERIKGRVIVGVDEDDTDFNISGKTGGEKEHTLTSNEIPPLDVNLMGGRLGSHGTQELVYWDSGTINYEGVGKTVGGGQERLCVQPFRGTFRGQQF